MAAQSRADYDRTLGAAHRSYWEQHRATAMGKSVVLVEGDDDRDVLEVALTQRTKTWATKIHIAAAGGRDEVYKRLIDTFHAHNTFGLVDRDTWSDADVVAKKQNYASTFITEGWCLENIFLDPAWLAKINHGIAKQLASQRETWVRAGALWWTLQRAREGQQRWHEVLGWTFGLPHKDLDTSSCQSVRKCLEGKISPPIRDQARLDLGNIALQFEQRCQELLAMSEKDQWRLGVHGKAAFDNLLVPELSAVAAQKPSSAWRVELATQLPRPLPSPLNELVAVLLP